jgi:hypothetical protein
MALFKCNSSGNVLEFKDKADIKGLRNHLDYTEITSDGVPVPGHEELLAFWFENRKPKTVKKDTK